MRHGVIKRVATASLLVAAGVFGVPATAQAADGVTYLCSSGDFSCLAGTGYSGQSVWGSFGPGHNCVSYAAFRLEQTGSPRPWPDRIGNGNEWDEKARAAGVEVDGNPTVGSIAQWDTGSGHVAYVEAVTDTTIEVSEDNYPSTSTRRVISRSSATFASADFIHVRDAVTNRISSGQIGDGALVNYQGDLYRVVGGAPLYISTYDVTGGWQPSTTLSDLEFGSLRSTPADGTLVVGAQTGQVYRFAGGAALYVSTMDAVGGQQPLTSVDQAALDLAGAGGKWNHVAFRPANGTLVAGAQSGRVYRFVGGAPTYVATFDALGGPQPVVWVDQLALDNAGGGSVWDRVSFRPADGTVVLGGQTGRVYVTRGGHPTYVWDWAEIGGPQPTTTIDQTAIDNAGGPGFWAHLS